MAPGSVAEGVSNVSSGESPPSLSAFSCLACRQRKVKCDRHIPCSNCLRISKECTFIAPVRGKRRRTKPPKEGLHAKLKRYEELLKSYGAKVSNDGDSSDGNTTPSSRPDLDMVDASPASEKSIPNLMDEVGSRIIHKEDSSRYFDSSLWSRISQEYENPDTQNFVEAIRNGTPGFGLGCLGGVAPVISASSMKTDIIDMEESSLVLGYSELQNLGSLHPPLEVVMKLWEYFLERVDPLIKLLHTPTFWSKLNNALGDPHNIPKSLEALIFAMYASVFCSLDEDECQSLVRDQKAVLIARYRQATRQALINASFVKSSSIMTLQAYILFLLGMRGIYQSDSFYVLSGIALRLGRRMGLHRDGTSLDLSPFETEMRRRLWWQIVHADSRSSDFSGAKPSMDLFLGDTKLPLNLKDEDLTPDMLSFPPERVGITPVVLCLMRCDLTQFLQKMTSRAETHVSWEKLTGPHLSLEEKDKLIDQIEELLQSKYVRYCDPSEPLDFFTSILARSAVCKVRMMAHNPSQFAQRGIKISQKDRDIIWVSGTKLLEYGNMIHTNPITKRFCWQVGTGYLFDTLLYVLIETRHRKMGPDIDKTWQLIGSVFQNYPRIFQEATDTLYTALGNWTIQVWDDCAAARKAQGLAYQSEPDFIASIRRNRMAQAQPTEEQARIDHGKSLANSTIYSQPQFMGWDENSMSEYDPLQSYDFSNLPTFDVEPNEWAQWERLLSRQGV